MIIVTGGAGFIGSALVWGLNTQGKDNVLVVDNVDHNEKEHNLAVLKYERVIPPAEFRTMLLGGGLEEVEIETIYHLGAITSTTAADWDELYKTNVELSKDIIRWSADHGVRCVYASSAATYGDGSHGYGDDHGLFDQLEPLNLYGKSKLLIDIWARDGGYLDEVVGVRYFNVFGPNEYHKGDMQSVIARKYPKLREKGVVELFKSYDSRWKDGEQQRDFIYVKDAVHATLYLGQHSRLGGVFNVGSGLAKTWNDVAQAMLAATAVGANIRYIDMPENLRDQYQYFSQADIKKLRAAGYDKAFMSLGEAIQDYIKAYLEPHCHLGEGSSVVH